MVVHMAKPTLTLFTIVLMQYLLASSCAMSLFNGEIDTGDKARIQKLQKDLKTLEQIIDTVDKDEAARRNANPVKKRQFTDPEEESSELMETKRYPNLQWQLCPDSVDRLECFDNYMVLWLHMVGDRQGKRTYVGKRASGLRNEQRQEETSDDTFNGDAHRKPNVNLYDILYGKVPHLGAGTLIPGDSRKQSEDDEIRSLLNESQIRQMCSNSENKDLCFRVGLVKAMNTLFDTLHVKGSAASKPVIENKLRKRGLCDGVSDTVSCFDHYLGMFATTMHSNSGGANQFVGRRMVHK